MFKPSKEHIRHALIYEFHKKSPVEDAYNNILIAYGKGSIGLNTCQKWYTKFHGGDFDISDKPKTGRKVQFDVERLIDIIRRNSHLSLNELQAMLGASSETIRRHLQMNGWMHKYGRWIQRQTKANRIANEKARQEFEMRAQNREIEQQQLDGLHHIPGSMPFNSSFMPSTSPPPLSPLDSAQEFSQNIYSSQESPQPIDFSSYSTQDFLESAHLPEESPRSNTSPILGTRSIPESSHRGHIHHLQSSSSLVLPSEARLMHQNSPRSFSQPPESRDYHIMSGTRDEDAS
jgi:hypothetical protein